MAGVAWKSAPDARIRVGGHALEIACLGPPPCQAPTIVMLHEGLGCIALWRDVPARLSDATGCGVLVYSRAGYGQSDPSPLPRPLDYMTREAEDVLPCVLEACGVGCAIVLGHSDGATIAAIHAGSVGDRRVRGLVLMAPHFFTEPGGLQAIRRARDAYETGDLRARLGKYHAHPDVAFRGWNDAWLDPGFETWDVTGVLDRIRVPVLALQGDADQYGSRAQVDVIAARSPSAVRIAMLGDCGHSPHLEQPGQTLAEIAGFVSANLWPALPEHRHIPGQNARHAEGAFDQIRGRALSPTISGEANANPAWLYGLKLLEAGYCWEAHEVLEPVWMNAAPNSPERHMVQGVIQLANAALKQDMGRPNAARRLCDLADDLIASAGDGAVMGLDAGTVRAAIGSVRQGLASAPTGSLRLRI